MLQKNPQVGILSCYKRKEKRLVHQMNIFLMAYKIKSESQAAFGKTFRQLSESRNKLSEEGYWKYCHN
jgi:hypothetical protein